MKVCNSIAEKLIMAVDGPFFASRIAKKIDTTYTHASKTLKVLKSEGIVKASNEVKNNRTNLLELTNKGKKIKEYLIKLKALVNE